MLMSTVQAFTGTEANLLLLFRDKIPAETQSSPSDSDESWVGNMFLLITVLLITKTFHQITLYLFYNWEKRTDIQ